MKIIWCEADVEFMRKSILSLSGELCVLMLYLGVGRGIDASVRLKLLSELIFKLRFKLYLQMTPILIFMSTSKFITLRETFRKFYDVWNYISDKVKWIKWQTQYTIRKSINNNIVTIITSLYWDRKWWKYATH